MAQEFSFDVVSKVDAQELRNAVDQAQKEVGTRYDFKGSISSIELEDDGIRLHSDDEFRLKALREVLQAKMARRNVPLESFEYEKMETAAQNTVRQHVKLKQGIDADTGRKVVKAVKELGIKVQAQIQGDQVRVSARAKDDLQKVITALKAQDFGVPIQFVNYR